MVTQPEDVLAFWFDEVGKDAWFKKSDALDRTIGERFGAVHGAALAGELDHWRDSADGSLALILVLDQFSRNMHRGTAAAFAGDAQALAVAKEAVARGFDQGLPDGRRQFFYMPFMHSEDLADQERCVELFEGHSTIKWAVQHRDIVARFGRFPHRNEILGRASSDEEDAFLTKPGSSF